MRDGHRSWLLAVITGAVLFLWTTRTLMRNLTVVNAHAWRADLPKASQKNVLINTLMFGGIWVLVFAFTAVLHKIVRAVPGGVVLGFLGQAVVVSGVWFMLIKRFPDRRRSWIDLVPGALLFGFGLSLLNVVGRIYLPPRFAHSSQVYGSLGIASVMLFWMLLIGQLVVSCALVNSVWRDYRADRAGVTDETVEAATPATGLEHL